ncbi:Pectin lyase-like protein [Glarea lozoyensis ATCC 20868]|uniref:Pectin lyase-like protein n=1 Tax=Glarea lozoyensis (strain ATCC 20868 / MF5171) TaxID=1116229 RepID=S3CFA6_GLAL2|nr:Pectin lyase-like protein [Glarea lozoyensis ATCC 20868]EPE25182.1 Pectin lyase-like protein [Glarea lozoyensis ATCC 20868]
MHFRAKQLLLLGVTNTVATSLKIPWVDSVVELMTSELSSAVHYNGPSSQAQGAHDTSSHQQVLQVSQESGHSDPPDGSPEDDPDNSPPTLPYWFEHIKHQGVAAFNSKPSEYQVYRNVKDFGAKGDGKADDTTAINNAIKNGGRCEPGKCNSTTITPAVVYFPAGTYKISSSIIDYYYTQLIGNPNNLTILHATSDFKGFGLIDGNRYAAGGKLGFGSTNLFYRQVRNFVFDTRNVSAESSVTGIHWPTAQATSLQNCVFQLSDAPGTQHQGIFIEDGSGGFMSDLEFYGGNYGMSLGNQQFTMRNIKLSNSVTAINQFWNWGWTFMGIEIENCTTGLNMSSGGSQKQTVGSVTFIDSIISRTKVGIITAHSLDSSPKTAGNLVLENIRLHQVDVAVQGESGTLLNGTPGYKKVQAWAQGHQYTLDTAPRNLQQPSEPFYRPESLTRRGRFYTRSKPQYERIPLDRFVSVRDAGAKGDGETDDTLALARVIQSAAENDQIVYIDAGTYKVTSTIYIPPNSKIVGETYPVILGYGAYFSQPTSPKAVLRVGNPGEAGIVELSDLILSTQGATSGAILIEWNLATPGHTPSGIWDVHTRIGGFKGSQLSYADCPASPNTISINLICIAAFASVYLSPSASGLYLENVWLWVADHDIDDPELRQTTIYGGRGFYSESRDGNIFLVGTASEHHAMYQYQFANTKNVFAGQLQTETAYYQPNPPATKPFEPVEGWNDPIFPRACEVDDGNCRGGWGLRVLNSRDLLVYGAGLYSFFSNCSTDCSKNPSSPKCQTRIFSLEARIQNVNVYNLNTIGVKEMINIDGEAIAEGKGNENVFPNSVAIFRSDGDKGYDRGL